MQHQIHTLRTAVVLVLFMTLLMMAGCSSTAEGWSQESYRNPDFDVEDLVSGKVALFPAIVLNEDQPLTDKDGKIPSAPYASSTDVGAAKTRTELNMKEAYQVVTSDMLLNVISDWRPDIPLISASETLIIMNDHEMNDEYRAFSSEYTRYGFNSSVLRKFGEVLECKYILITQAFVSDIRSQASTTFVWTFGKKAILRSAKVYGQIWDTETGHVVWEGTGVGYLRLATYEGAPLIEDLVDTAVRELLKNIIPNGKK